MTASKPLRAASLAPLLVGFAAASAAEIAVGVLLYAGPGLMRSLTLVLGVEAAALGVGLWSASRPPDEVTEAVRKRWLLCLTAFLAAAVFAALWTFIEPLGGAALGQGLGLAFLAALPMYTCGAVLATISVAVHTDPDTPYRDPGAPAALGAALGFVATGIALPQSSSPSSVLLGCIVLLSLGGLIQGAALARRPQVQVVADREETAAPIRVEDRYLAASGAAVRVLLEGAHPRHWQILHGGGEASWDVAVARAAMPASDVPWRVLVVGGGASSSARVIVREHPLATVDVLERSASVVELGAEHLGSGLAPGEDGRVRVLVGNLEDLALGLADSYDLILLDGRALVPLGGAGGLSRRAWDSVVGRLSARGIFACGPISAGDPGVSEFASWTFSVYSRTLAVDGLVEAWGNGREVVRVGAPGPEPPLAAGMDGFRREEALPT